MGGFKIRGRGLKPLLSLCSKVASVLSHYGGLYFAVILMALGVVCTSSLPSALRMMPKIGCRDCTPKYSGILETMLAKRKMVKKMETPFIVPYQTELSAEPTS